MRHTPVTTFFLLCTAGAVCQAQTPSGFTVTTFAGVGGPGGFAGDGSQATSAQLNYPFAAAVGSNGNVYISDQGNSRIRMVTPAGTITTVAGNGTAGYLGDGGPATSAELNNPGGVAVDSAGNLYIADTLNHVVRKVTSSGTITTVAGNNGLGFGYGGDFGPANMAQLADPSGVAVDSAGNLYIADTSNNLIRKVDSTGTITTIAGVNNAAYLGDGGPAFVAGLNNPEALAFDSAGNMYIADTNNYAIRMISVSGVITTVAGNGQLGFAGDGGFATNALLNNPKGVAVDSAGNIYIADTFNDRIRMVTPGGIITTIAGNGQLGFSGNGVPAITAAFYFPSFVAVDGGGNVYVADNQNNMVRELEPLPPVVYTGGAPAIAPNGVTVDPNYGGFSSIAPGSLIVINGTNLAVDARPWNAGDFHGINAPTSLDGTTVTIGGLSAFVSNISPGQVSAQVPANVGTGPEQVIVSTAAGGPSAPYLITVNSTEPGLYSPAMFNVGGTQYVAATFTDNTTYVLPPGAVPGITSRQAMPGETIIVYGSGFGPVRPNVNPGQIAQTPNTLTAISSFQLGGAPATASYSGLELGAVGSVGIVGVYQFSIVVPNIGPSDITPITFTLGGAPGTQTLYTAIGSPSQ